MATKEEVLAGLKKVEGRFGDPALKEKFATFTKNMQFNFPDLETSFVIRVANGEVTALNEEAIEKPELTVTMNSDDFIGILNKSVNPVSLYMTGKLKVKGGMTDLLKLQKLLF